MAHYRKRNQLDFEVARDLEIDGVTYSVDLIAKRATGVPGYRLTLAYVAEDGSRTAFVELDPAPGREEARLRAEALAADVATVRSLLVPRATGA